KNAALAKSDYCRGRIKENRKALCQVRPIKVHEREMPYRYFDRQRLFDLNKNLQGEVNGSAEEGKSVGCPQTPDRAP
ncbi:hypothetical protein MAR_038368, partial [Mya arenaria]